MRNRVKRKLYPVVGAVGGAAVNLIFMNHFQRIAEGHFTIRRLERIYGRAVYSAPVRAALLFRTYMVASARLEGEGGPRCFEARTSFWIGVLEKSDS
jgi:hypothetical protein